MRTLLAGSGLSSSHPRVVLQHRPDGVPFEGVELHYFCLRGLGELPRLMLEVTQTAYDSVMYFDTKEYKDIGPFGQMPLLKDPPNLGGGMGTGGWLPQSSAIVRHIARVTNLDAGPDDPVLQVSQTQTVFAAGSRHPSDSRGLPPHCSPTPANDCSRLTVALISFVYVQARIDFVFEGSKDIGGKRSIVYIAEDDAEGVESSDYQRGHTYLKNATTLLGDSDWWAGDSMTYADVAMFAALHGLDELKPGFLESNGACCPSIFLTHWPLMTCRG